MAVQPQDLRLLSNTRFRRLLLSRLVGQAGQNALAYALLVLVVEETGSSVKSALLVVSFILPTIILGIPAGALADVLPKRFTMTLGYLLRAAVIGAMVYYRGDVWALFLLVMAFSTVSQLSGPAESAAVPAIVGAERLPAANSLMVLTTVLGQVAGMVVIAPFLFKLFGSIPALTAAASLVLTAGIIIATVPVGRGPPAEPPLRRGFSDSLLRGFTILRENRRAFLAVTYIIITGTLTKVLVVLLPHYTDDVLHIKTEDTVFVAAPAAIGAALGLLLTPALARLIGSWRVVAFGLFLFLLGLVALGLVVYVRDFVEENLELGLSFVEEEVGVSSVITMTMILAIPLGLAHSLVSVAGRAVLNEEAPQEGQARVFAVQTTVGDFVALAPLFIVGAVADLVGVRATLLAAAVAALLLAAYLTFSTRFRPPAAAAAAGPTSS